MKLDTTPNNLNKLLLNEMKIVLPSADEAKANEEHNKNTAKFHQKYLSSLGVYSFYSIRNVRFA